MTVREVCENANERVEARQSSLTQADMSAASEKPIKRMVITGGTHGNESNSVQLAKHFLRNPDVVKRESFTTEVLLTNPESITRNLRYCDEDLNRCFFLADLADESRSTLEAKRAREVNAALGPKGSEGAADYILDLHNTTANTGVAIMCSPHDRLSHALALYLQSKDPTVRLILWNRSSKDYPMLPSVGKHGMTFEVGPCPWGCVVGELYAQSLALVGHALDYLHAHNTALASVGGGPWRDAEMDAFVNTGKRGFPRDADGELAGMIHPELQGRDFLPLNNGDPIFLSHGLEVERFAAEASTLPDAAGCACGEATIYPFFIGEAAYYEKGKDMAFMLARKETLKVCGVCVVPPSSE
tara:strand:- start:1806 stop:2876 length:1071 start_codon:yes stop_codon:yes gene_type:complete